MTAFVKIPQSGDRRSTNIQKETTQGVPAAGAWQTLRPTGGAGVVGNFSTIESQELTGTAVLGTKDLIAIGETGQADYAFEATYGITMDYGLESAFQAEFGDVTTDRLLPGTDEVTLSVEDIFNDISKVQSIQAGQVSSFNLSITSGEAITGSMSIVAPTFNIGTPTPLAVAADVTNTNEIEIASGNGASATTNAAGYALLVQTITLASAGTGDYKIGDNFTIAGDTQVYIVTSGDTDVSDGGTISFTPGLKVAITTSATALTRTDQSIPSSAIVGATVLLHGASTTANNGYYTINAVSGDKVTVDGTLTNVTAESVTLEFSTASIQGTTPTAAASTKVFVAGNSVGVELSFDAGATWFDSLDRGFRFPSLEFAVAVEVAQYKEITLTEAFASAPVNRTIDINLGYYLIDSSPMQYMANGTEVGVRFTMIDGAGSEPATGNKYIFTQKRCKTVSATPGEATKGSEMTGTWNLKVLLDTSGISTQVDRTDAT